MKKLTIISTTLLLALSGQAQAQVLQQIDAANGGVLAAPGDRTQASATEMGKEGFMLDPEFNLKSVQEAWNDPQSRADSVKRFPYDPTTTFPLQLRQNMSSLIVLPEGETIDIVSLADTLLFNYVYLGAQGGKTNMLTVSGSAPGSDTSMQVITSTGRVYNFYLRNDGVQSNNIPTLTLYITDPAIQREYTSSPYVPADLGSNNDETIDIEFEPLDLGERAALEDARADYLKSLDLSKDVNLDYRITGDSSVAPRAVYDDGDFVYMDFSGIVKFGELPVVFRVVDGIDERVNTQWDEEEQRYVIKTLSREGFTLRSGDKVVCVRPL